MIFNRTNYLVVCQNLKQASFVCRLLEMYLSVHDIPYRVVNRGGHIFIELLCRMVTVRFTSKRKYEEVVLGAHDWWVVTGDQVEEWLDAAEEHEKEN